MADTTIIYPFAVAAVGVLTPGGAAAGGVVEPGDAIASSHHVDRVTRLAAARRTVDLIDASFNAAEAEEVETLEDQVLELDERLPGTLLAVAADESLHLDVRGVAIRLAIENHPEQQIRHQLVERFSENRSATIRLGVLQAVIETDPELVRRFLGDRHRSVSGLARENLESASSEEMDDGEGGSGEPGGQVVDIGPFPISAA